MTEFGDINRKIEKELDKYLEGDKDALQMALKYAREREEYLKKKLRYSGDTQGF